MYDLPYFKEQDQSTVIQFVKEHPFAFISGVDESAKPVATQVPVFIDEKNGKIFLSGHLMRNTDHHKAFIQNPNVLTVFTGANTYVSASWYNEKRQASTWNYMSVYTKGSITFLDEQALMDVLKRTTDHFENDPVSGSNFADIPGDYIHHLSKAIVAFEIEVSEIENVFKLSQNRDEKSYHSIIEKLGSKGYHGQIIASEMKKRADDLFKRTNS
jgi:transcriptional regulator